MQPSIKRRTFLKLFALPALAFVRPRATQASAPGYTDDVGTADLTKIHDRNLSTGIEYQP